MTTWCRMGCGRPATVLVKDTSAPKGELWVCAGCQQTMLQQSALAQQSQLAEADRRAEIGGVIRYQGKVPPDLRDADGMLRAGLGSWTWVDGAWRADGTGRTLPEEVAALRARVAELEAALQGSRERGNRAVDRVAELEAIVVGNDSAEAPRLRLRCAELEGVVEQCEEDLRRKREECERMEKALADERLQRQRYQARWEDAAKQLSDATCGNARLRRELGRRKP